MTEALHTSVTAFRVGQNFGGYRVLRLLGRGGMGEVYEAVDEHTGRPVALKVMSQRLESETDRKRFLREGRLAASVNHPNVVYIFGSEEIDGLPVILMELVPHGTLKDRVASTGPLPVHEAVDLTLQLIDGLEAAERAGILHRDIKPANCFMDADGTVKVGDFGLSISTLSRPETALTHTGTMLGTPSYSPPEQLRGEPLDVTADIYSLGATLYYLLTGRPPYDGRELVQVLAQVLQQQPRQPRELRSDVPRGLSRVVVRCLAKARASRFSNYAELRKALLPYASTAARPATVARRAAAGAIDEFILALPELVPAIAAYDVAVFARTPAALALFFGLFVGRILYFGVTEGLWGATPGKSALGLCVSGPADGPPGLPRGLARATAYELPKVLPWLLVLPFVTATRADADAFVLYLYGIGAVLIATLFVTMRRRNGYAAIHDLLTGTRVVTQGVRDRRLPSSLRDRDSSTPSSAVPSGRHVVDNGDHFGPFQLLSTLRSGPPEVLLGIDPVLDRQVFIIRYEGGSTVEPIPAGRRNLARRGRPRWLAGDRTPERAWDAFDIPRGTPLLALREAPYRWDQVRGWLDDLTAEIMSEMADPVTAAPATLERVWIAHDGRALLLDFPAHAPDADSESENATPIRDVDGLQAFLDRVATHALEGNIHDGNSAPSVAPRARLPINAHLLLAKLRAGAFTDVASILQTLRDPDHRTMTVSRPRRAASLLTFAAIIGVLVSAAALEEWNTDRRWSRDHSTLPSPRLVRAIYHERADEDPELRRAVEILVAARYQPLLSAATADDSILHDSEFAAFMDSVMATGASGRGVQGEQISAASGTYVADATDVLRASIQEHANPRAFIVLGITLACAWFVSLVSSLVAVLVGRHLGLGVFGIGLVGQHGVPAGRLRLLARGAVLAAFYVGSVLFLVLSDGGWVSAVVTVVVVAACVLWTLLAPKRGPHDRIAGTWLVPR